MPIVNNFDKLVSSTVHDNRGSQKGVTIGFDIRHPDTGQSMVSMADADEDELEYVIARLRDCQASLRARKDALSRG